MIVRTHPLWAHLAAAIYLLGAISPAFAAITLTGDTTPTDVASVPAASFFTIGNTGVGSLSIDAGSDLESKITSLGSQAGSFGNANVTGAGSTWSADWFSIGTSGHGTMQVVNGAVVSNVFAYLGERQGSTSNVTINGVGSSWNNSDRLYVGFGGTANLDVEAGATLSSTHGYIGAQAGSSGMATITGQDSSWNVSERLQIGYWGVEGYSGSGSLVITDGGTVTSAGAHLGRVGVSVGAVEVAGASSSWTNHGFLWAYNGTLDVRSGGTINTNGASLALMTATVDGGSLNSSRELDIASGGDSKFTVGGGGVVNALSSYVGRGHAADVLVTGDGSSYNVDSILYLGRGVMQVEKQAKVTAQSSLIGALRSSATALPIFPPRAA